MEVIAFAWVSIQDSILTMEHFEVGKKIIGNVCPLWRSNAESVNQFLLNCTVAREACNAVLSWFGISQVFSNDITVHVGHWKFGFQFYQGNTLDALHCGDYVASMEEEEQQIFRQ